MSYFSQLHAELFLGDDPMHKLTQAELEENDVIVIITDQANLPKEAWEVLRLYIGHRNANSTTYKLPAYQARELNELSRLHQQALAKGQ